MVDTVASLERGEPPSEPRPGARAWPSAVRQELSRRRARVLDASAGRVLDLADDDADRLVTDAAAGRREPTERFDTIISVGALVRFPDLALALREVGRLLAPEGRFLFVEPVGRPGWWGVAEATAGAVLAPVRDQHLGRDVPLAVRSGGFLVTAIERFTMPTSVWPLRPFVHGCAVRTPEALR
jgi:SAM-dependent methyltransferase